MFIEVLKQQYAQLYLSLVKSDDSDKLDILRICMAEDFTPDEIINIKIAALVINNPISLTYGG